MTLKPLGDRVLVKPAPKEEKTSTGLYISSGAQEKPQRGQVVAVGAGKMNDKGERIAIDVKVGDEGEIFGRRQRVDDLAAILNTIPYELTCAVSKRVPRVYIEGGKIVERSLHLL